MSELDDEIRAMQLKLQELQDKKHLEELLAEEERKRKELESPREIRVRAFEASGIVSFQVLPTIRTDILETLRASNGRMYDHYAETNRYYIDNWIAIRDKLLALPNIKLVYLAGVEENINNYLFGPEFVITNRDRYLLITCHPRAITGVLNKIPGVRRLHGEEISIPLSEGWRLIEIFENYTRMGEKKEVIWDSDALILVQKELERRVSLDTIAQKKDISDFVSHLAEGCNLLPFQKVGVSFIDATNGRALIADQMGLGKTWQAIEYAERNNLRTVIICPAHLKANWSREIVRLTGKTPLILSGREPTKQHMINMLANKSQYTIINYDILSAKVTESEKFVKNDDGTTTRIPARDRFLWAELINLSKPDLIITDEAHYYKNTDANRTRAILSLDSPHRLALTGTPVLNRIGEYFSILHWTRPDLFPGEERFYRDYTVDGKRPRNVEALRDILKPIMLRRLKKDVVSDLPPLNRITDLHELSAVAQGEYERVLKGVYKAIDDAGNNVEKNINSILVQIGKLKEVCAKDKVERTVELAKELYDSSDENGEIAKKVLIFSQFKQPVYEIAAQLGEGAICWTGDTPMEERTKLEYEFQNNPNVKYLVISLMTGQTGLNLTAAGHVIFNDLYWTPAAHAQAEERAYGRLSDLHGANSYYITAVNTIEDWIQQLLQAKLSLINNVVEGIDAERDSSIAMSIIQKLKETRK